VKISNLGLLMETLRRDLPPPESITLATRSWGLGTAEIVLLHGFGDGAFVWDAIAPRLSDLAPTIAPDLRGHGNSPWDTLGRYAICHQVGDVLCLVDQLGPKPIVLVGHSMGAAVAAHVAAARSASVVGLVIIDGGPGLDAATSRFLLEQFAQQPRRYGSLYEYECVLATRLVLAQAETLRCYAAGALRPRADVGYELKYDPVLRNGIPHTRDRGLRDTLSDVTCPILLVRGGMSAMLSNATAVLLSKGLSRCKLVTVPMAGHAVPLENPAGLLAVISPFLRACLREPG